MAKVEEKGDKRFAVWLWENREGLNFRNIWKNICYALPKKKKKKEKIYIIVQIMHNCNHRASYYCYSIYRECVVSTGCFLRTWTQSALVACHYAHHYTRSCSTLILNFHFFFFFWSSYYLSWAAWCTKFK